MGEVIGQAIGTAIAAHRILVQAFQTDRFQVARHLGGQLTRRRRVPADHLLQRIPDRLAVERRPAGQQFVQDGTERVDVSRRSGRGTAATGLLGSHVIRCAENVAAAGLGIVGVEALGQAEVGDLGRAVRCEQDIGRLQVAVHHAGPVRGMDGPCQRFQQRGRIAHRLRAAT